MIFKNLAKESAMSRAVMIPRQMHFQNYENETIGDYDINEKIREDDNATTFLGRNLTNHRDVTIRGFHIMRSHPKNIHDLMQKEFDKLKDVTHETLAPLLAFFGNTESLFVATPFYPAGDLQKYIMAHGGRSEDEAAQLFKQIVEAVAELHAHGIAHGDLRLNNIAITKYPSIVVTGYHFCASVGTNRLYSSPEKICHIRHDEKLSDIWALGVILYVLVTGRHPFNDNTTTSVPTRILHASFTIPDTISSECRDLLLNTIAIRPQARLTAKQILNHPWFTAAKAYTTYKFDITTPPRNIGSSRGGRMANLAATAPQTFRPIKTAMTTGRLGSTLRRRPSQQIRAVVIKLREQEMF